jgi:S1-C subfamily serine protease
MRAPTVHRTTPGMTAPIGHRTARKLLLLLVPAVVVLAAVATAASLVAISNDSPPPDAPAVIPLRVTAGGEIATGFASGRNRVVTVAHLVAGAAREDGLDAVRVGRARATVLRVDRRSDLALLGVPGAAGRLPRVAAADAGDEVRLLRLRRGRPLPLSARVRRAIVAHVRAPGAERPLTRPALELSARVRPGDSGAALVTESGALAGVVFAASSGRENTAYAVDAGAAAQLLARD